MSKPNVHIAYAPRGAGVLYAVLWFEFGHDVVGWYIGTRDGVAQPGYFVLPGFLAVPSVVLYHSRHGDLYGPWVEVGDQHQRELPHPPPLPQTLCIELSRLQDEFVQHWLFFGDDPKQPEQVAALHECELPVCPVNVRAERLGELRRPAAVWRYDTPGTDWTVLAHLSQRWPLDEKVSSRDFEP